jgi:putative RNA 2'-phosphotransferase
MKNKNISKFLSLVLRHKPEVLDLNMDQNGWVDLEELIEKMKANGKPVSRADIVEVVATNPKQRFKLDESNNRIRANQGHSIAVDVELLEKVPPRFLYHGTAVMNKAIISKEGLKKMNRQHVHLSEAYNTALEVGRRHGKPMILKIDCEQMIKDGFRFYLSENKVWLTDTVAVKYIEFE